MRSIAPTPCSNWGLRSKHAGENDFRELIDQSRFGDRAIGAIPLVNPVDHSEQGKRRSLGSDAALGAAGVLRIFDEALDKMHIFFLPRVNEAAVFRRQGMVLMQ